MKIQRLKGKKGVLIRKDEHGSQEILTMVNDFQWSGMPIDDDVVEMLASALAEFKEKK